MAGFERAAIVADDDEQFDTKDLVRLGVWGLAATFSLILMVFAARSDLGSQRIGAALKAIAATPEEQQSVVSAQLLARTANAEREARRAAETVIALSADRERMVGRVSTAEREIAELNGSVQRALTIASDAQLSSPPLSLTTASLLTQPRNPPPAEWALPIVPGGPVVAAAGPAVATANPSLAAASSAPVTIAAAERAPEPIKPQNVPLPRPAPLAAAPVTIPQPVMAPAPPAAAPPPATVTAAASPPPTVAPPDAATAVTGGINATSNAEPPVKVEFGVDLGPALTTTRLRARWAKLAKERPDLVKDLRPLITVHDTAPGKPVEVRLVIGPLANVNAATEFCAMLASPQYVCQPSVFDGQRLTVQ
ncbi:MAG: hypothetical protein ACXWKA_04895 [Xanthobacteraceae bacterium]